MRERRPDGRLARVSTAPLLVTLELDVSGQPVEGQVRLADRTAWGFSGWSELFAVLQTLTSQAAGDPSQPPGGTT
jgi:hypothetical protein